MLDRLALDVEQRERGLEVVPAAPGSVAPRLRLSGVLSVTSRTVVHFWVPESGALFGAP